MTKINSVLGVVLLGIALTACAPFIDSRREAGQVTPVGQSKPDHPAICYNPLWTKQESLQSLADEACAAIGKKAVHEDTKYFNCRLFFPNTALFKCQ